MPVQGWADETAIPPMNPQRPVAMRHILRVDVWSEDGSYVVSSHAFAGSTQEEALARYEMHLGTCGELDDAARFERIHMKWM